MNGIARRDGGALEGHTVAVLLESDFVEYEVHYYQRRFAEEGARVEFLTRLWGRTSLTVHGHEQREPLTVDGDLEAVDDSRMAGWSALVVPGGMVSDRLRYTEVAAATAPAVALLDRAFGRPELLKGIICHGMWLATPIPIVIRGRRVTCHNNLIGDVRNAGAEYVDQDVVVDDDLVTARTAGHCHLFARAIIDLTVARRRTALGPVATIQPRTLPTNGTSRPTPTGPTLTGQPR